MTKTFAITKRAFEAAPSTTTAADYMDSILHEASEGIESDDTLLDALAEVRDWLREEAKAAAGQDQDRAAPGAAIRVLRMGGYSVPGVPAMTDEEKDKAARAEADRVFAETVTDPAGLEWLLTP